MNLITYTDGGSRGNPGPSAIGVVIKNASERILYEEGTYIGLGTNNEAEYKALIRALHKARELGGTAVECRMDSKLVAEQMNRKWKIKEPRLQKLFVEAWNAAQHIPRITFVHVRREYNTEPDKLLNTALDAHV